MGDFPTSRDTEAPTEDDDQDRRLHEQHHRAAPEIHGVEGLEVFGKIPDEQRADRGHEPEEGHRGLALQPQSFFEEGDARLEHRQRARDRRNEEQNEEDGGKQVAGRHQRENLGQHVKPESKRALAHNAGGAQKHEGGRHGDEATQTDFAKFVGRRCRQS